MSLRKMYLKPICIVLCILFYTSDVYSQSNKCDTTFYIKFDFSRHGRILDENYIEKRVVSYIWVFSRTLGNINDINDFYVENDKRQITLSLMELKKISFTTLEDMIKYKEQNPVKKKIRINLVEITINKESFIYNDVRWKRMKSNQ